MMNIGLGTKIAAVLGLALAGTGFFAKMQTDRIDKLKGQISTLKGDVAFQKQVVSNLAGRVVKSEGLRTAERSKCVANVAGLIDQHKGEIAKATAAATARATLTRACPSRPLTPAERLAALRVNSGESK